MARWQAKANKTKVSISNSQPHRIRHWKKVAFLGFLTFPIILASCAPNSIETNAQFTNQLISLGDGNQLTNQISLQSYLKTALTSDEGQKQFLNHIVKQLAFHWFENASQNSNNITYQDLFNNKVKEVDDQFSTIEDNLRNQTSNDPALFAQRLQVEQLDSKGGTVASWKQSELNDWAISQLETLLFENNYLTFQNAQNELVANPQNATVQELYQALSHNKLLFASPKNNNVAVDINFEYANFLNYIFEQFVLIQNPFIVDMSLWKYGVPAAGLSQYYLQAADSTTSDPPPPDPNNPDAMMQMPTTTPNAGTYIHPVFANSGNDQSLDKFQEFVRLASQATVSVPNIQMNGGAASSIQNGSKIPFLAPYDQKAYGLLSIPQRLTDDSSTYILAKNGTISNDLFPEFAAASSYLFWKNSAINGHTNFAFNQKPAGIHSIDHIWTKDLDLKTTGANLTDAKTGLDIISQQFISTTMPFAGQNQSPVLKLDKSYVRQLINPNGPIGKLAEQDLYVVDAFVPKNHNLQNFFLLRNQAGVHAITIDGYYYIHDQTSTELLQKAYPNYSTTNLKKLKAGQVLLFRTLYNNITSASKEMGYDFTINLQSELQTFFKDNMAYLIFNYAQKSDQQLFDLKALFGENFASDQVFLTAQQINAFLHQINYMHRVENYNSTLYRQKMSHGANFGFATVNNGLAAKWALKNFDIPVATNNNSAGQGLRIIEEAADSNQANANQILDSSLYQLNPLVSYEVAATTTTTYNPFVAEQTLRNWLRMPQTNGETNTNQLRNPDGSLYVNQATLHAQIDAAIAAVKPFQAEQSNVTAQILLTNNPFWNQALLGFSNNQTNFDQLVKMTYLKTFLGTDFDFNNHQFTNGLNSLQTALANGLANHWYKPAFDEDANRFTKLSFQDALAWHQTVVNDTNKPSSNDNMANSQLNTAFQLLQKQRKQSWLTSIQVQNSGNQTKLYEYIRLLALIKHYVADDFAAYFARLQTQLPVNSYNYLVWANNQNEFLNGPNVLANDQKALLTKNTVNPYLNNTYVHAYIGLNNLSVFNQQNPSSPLAPASLTGAVDATMPTVIMGNKANTVPVGFYQVNNANNYHVVANMNGFFGLQTTINNSGLDQLWVNRLFTDPNLENFDQVGVLYQYESSEQLVNLINNTNSLTAINSLATDLFNKTKQTEFDLIANNNELLATKQASLVQAVTNLAKLAPKLFSPRDGFVNFNEQVFVKNNSDNLIGHAAYAIQLNRIDLLNYANFKKRLMAASLNEQQITEVLTNLVVQASLDANAQTDLENQLLATQKVQAFDVRLYQTLGAEWIQDWKVTNKVGT